MLVERILMNESKHNTMEDYRYGCMVSTITNNDDVQIPDFYSTLYRQLGRSREINKICALYGFIPTIRDILRYERPIETKEKSIVKRSKLFSGKVLGMLGY